MGYISNNIQGFIRHSLNCNVHTRHFFSCFAASIASQPLPTSSNFAFPNPAGVLSPCTNNTLKANDAVICLLFLVTNVCAYCSIFCSFNFSFCVLLAFCYTLHISYMLSLMITLKVQIYRLFSVF